MPRLTHESMLTTFDNPYDPFTNYPAWYAFDEAAGYSTNGLLARIAVFSDELSSTDQALALEAAMDEILNEDVEGLYKKVTRKLESSEET